MVKKLTFPMPGRRRYLRWPQREAMRQQVLREQAAALEEVGKHITEVTTRDAPERGYPKPKRRGR